MIPVRRISWFSSVAPRLIPTCFKGSPIPLASRVYPTLAEGKTITFVETGKDTTLPEWKRVLINGGIQITNAKEVCHAEPFFLTHLISPLFEAINGVLYVIDGTIQDD